MKITCIPSGMLQANTYIVAEENTNKAFIVDPGGYSKKTVDLINNENYELEYIILTHGHSDHTDGVAEYKRLFPAAKIVACEKERELLEDPRKSMSYGPIDFEVEIWVKDGDVLKLGDKELKILHTPGHTPGGMCILVENHLFSGDTLFQYSIGRTDFWGGSFADIKKSIQNKLYVLHDDTIVYPGHMGTTTIGAEKRGNPFV
ncbi:MAG: MBL fold metallo-hydrolase [Firmicutes bacterium]|nr:MBL fold metallo-hydrolase [Bacillota bacterium]MBQ9973297.1 MBL fold metallo-hydrolase [Bacillota bacterium]